MVKVYQYKIMVNVNIKIMVNIKIDFCRPAIGGELTPGLVNYMTRFLFLLDKPAHLTIRFLCVFVSDCQKSDCQIQSILIQIMLSTFYYPPL